MKSVTQLQTSRKRLNRSHLLSTITKKALPILLVVLFVAQIISPFIVSAEISNSNPNYTVTVSGDKYTVTSWDELKELIENGRYKDKNGSWVSVGNTLDIIINGSIGANSEITINSNKTITLSGKNEATVYAAIGGTEDNPSTTLENNKFSSMFIVDGGTLNIDENVTLSGKRAVECDGTCSIVLSDSSVTYTHSDQHTYNNNSKTQYTHSVEGNKITDFSSSKVSYTPSQYTDNTEITYTPSVKSVFSYTPYDPGNECKKTMQTGLVETYFQNNYVGLRDTSTGTEYAFKYKDGQVFANYNPPYHDLPGSQEMHAQALPGASGQYVYYTAGTSYFYLRYDGTWHEGPRFNPDALINPISLTNPGRDFMWILDGNGFRHVDENWYLYVNFYDSGGQKRVEAIYKNNIPLVDDPGCVVRPATSNSLTLNGTEVRNAPDDNKINYASKLGWNGYSFYVYDTYTDTVEGRIKQGNQASGLTAGSFYYLKSAYGNYLVGTSNSNQIAFSDSVGDQYNATHVGRWQYTTDGVFKNTSTNQYIYFDGIDSVKVSNEETYLNSASSSSSLKLNGTRVYKTTSGVSPDGSISIGIYTLKKDNTGSYWIKDKEITSLQEGVPYYVQASDGVYLQATSNGFTWNSTLGNRTNNNTNNPFVWFYENGELKHNDIVLNYKSVSEEAKFRIGQNGNNTDTQRYANTPNGLFKTAEDANRVIYIQKTSDKSETDTLVSGNSYYIYSKNGYYLKADSTNDNKAVWVETTEPNSDYTWTYDGTNKTLSHGDLVIYNNGSVSVVDKTEKEIKTAPSLTMGGTQVFKASTGVSTTQGDSIYVFSVKTTNRAKDVEIASNSMQDNTPYYLVAANSTDKYPSDKGLKVDGSWEDIGNSRNNIDFKNPLIWYFDTTNNVFYRDVMNGNTKTGTKVLYKNSDGDIVIEDKYFPVFSLNGIQRYANTDGLFTPISGSPLIYMYNVETNGAKGSEPNNPNNPASNVLEVGKYYYIQYENGDFLKANEEGGSWASFENQTSNTVNNPYSWRYVRDTESNTNVLYNEATQQYIDYDNERSKSIIITKQRYECDEQSKIRWKPIDPRNEDQCPPSNWEHKASDLNYSDPNDERTKKGFFITATNNATINSSATYRDLWIDNSGAVKDYSPIAVNNSTFNMTGGSIENNWVGYTADDNKSDWPVNTRDSQNTWDYVGAELDTWRNATGPAPTRTAGGITFINESTGYINGSAYIKKNRGDIGGLLVHGDSVVYLGDNPNTATVEDGGHIDSNIGFHYSGAVLVENGGTLIMDGDQSSMNYNLTWNKGGAIWATEYGTAGDGYGVRGPKPANTNIRWTKDGAVNPGKFIMHNGNIQYNTAFHRGGAINVESDYVELYGGEISYNNCRALGGAIYVEGDAVNYNYTLVITKGYIGHNYAVSSDPSYQNETIRYHYENASQGYGYLDGETVHDANKILDRDLKTCNSTGCNVSGSGSTKIATKYSMTGFDTNESVLRECDDAVDSSDREVWQGYREYKDENGNLLYVSWEGNGGGLWLCPLGSTAVFNMNEEHEVFVDDNHATGVNEIDKRIGSDIYLMPGNGHIIAKEMLNEYWINEENGQKVPYFGTNDATSRIYSGPNGFVNVTTDANNPHHPTYDVDKAAAYETAKAKDQGIRIFDNLSRNGGGIAANGTVLFGQPTDVNRHEAEMNLTKRWTVYTPTQTLHYEMYYDNGTDNPDRIPGYDFTLRGEKQGEGEYTIVNEYAPTIDPDTGEELWKAKFSIPVTFTDDDNEIHPIYKFKDPERPGETIDPSTQTGTDRLLELVTRETNPITMLEIDPDSWKLILVEKDDDGNVLSQAVYKTPAVVKIDAKVNPIQPVGSQGQDVPSYSIRYSVVQFAQEVVNTNDTIEKYIENKVHQNYYSFNETIEYEIMAYIPADAEEVIIYDTLIAPLMFVDRDGNKQFTLNNNTDIQNTSFMSTNVNNTLITGYQYSPEWVRDFAEEDMSEIEVLAYGATNYFIKTKNNYYYKPINGDNSTWISITNNSEYIGYYNNNVNNGRTTPLTKEPALFVYDSNNHIGDGTGTISTIGDPFVAPLNAAGHVMIGDEPISGAVITMPSENKKDGNTLYVKIDESTGIKNVRGKWVKVVFNAAIKPSYQNIEKLHKAGYGWVDNDYNKQGNPLPDTKPSEKRNIVNTLNSFITQHNENDFIIKFIQVGERVYAKVDSGDENYRYYQLNLNGDNIWYRTFAGGNGTMAIAIDDSHDASEAPGGTYRIDSVGVGLDWLNHVKEMFGDKTDYPNELVRTELSESILVALDNYLARNNDSVATLKVYNSSTNGKEIKVYLVKTEKGDFYQRVREVGNVTVTDGIWYKTEIDGGNTKLTPVRGTQLGTPLSYGFNNEHDGNNNQLEGYNKVRDALNSNSEEIDLDEFRGISVIETGYNWPVIQAIEPHSGSMNEAKYAVLKNSSQSIAKSNVVTFEMSQPEKYVNNKTHDLLNTFDEVFEYEIMTYIPDGVDEVVIWDTLRDDLMFVDRDGKTQYVLEVDDLNNTTNVLNSEFCKDTLVYPMVCNSGDFRQLQYRVDNDHSGDGDGSVSKPSSKNNENGWIDLEAPITTSGYITLCKGADFDPDSGVVPVFNKEGNTIVVKIDSSTGINSVKNKWVRLKFRAAIKPTSYDDIASKIDDDSLYTTNASLKDPDYPDPIGYYYRDPSTTLYKENSLEGSSAIANRYYTKDTSGRFTIENTGNYPTTRSDGTTPTVEGVDYRLVYPAAFSKFSRTLPNELIDRSEDYQAVYVKDGWNDNDPTISWEFITEDGYVINGENLYEESKLPLGVQEDGDHAGLANKANVAIRIGNDYKSVHTNTVTVVPELEDIEITKNWIVEDSYTLPSINDFLGYLHLYRETTVNNELVETEITNTYSNNREVEVTSSYYEGNTRVETWKVKYKDLPKLTGNTNYSIKEDTIDSDNLLPPRYRNIFGAKDDRVYKNGAIDNADKNETLIEITANKRLIGKNLEARQFRFGLFDLEGKLLSEAYNEAPGDDGVARIIFEPFVSPGIGTYKYIIKELDTTPGDNNPTHDPNITYDSNIEREVQVKIRANTNFMHEYLDELLSINPDAIMVSTLIDQGTLDPNNWMELRDAIRKSDNSQLGGNDEVHVLVENSDGIPVYLWRSRKPNNEFVNIDDPYVQYISDTFTMYVRYNGKIYEGTFTIPENVSGYIYDGPIVKLDAEHEYKGTRTIVDYLDNDPTFENLYEGADVVIEKVWDDFDNVNGRRPKTLKVNLIKVVDDVEATVGSVTLDEENEWKYVWKALPKYEDGKKITYKIVEVKPLTVNYEETYTDPIIPAYGTVNTTVATGKWLNVDYMELSQSDRKFRIIVKDDDHSGVHDDTHNYVYYVKNDGSTLDTISKDKADADAEALVELDLPDNVKVTKGYLGNDNTTYWVKTSDNKYYKTDSEGKWVATDDKTHVDNNQNNTREMVLIDNSLWTTTHFESDGVIHIFMKLKNVGTGKFLTTNGQNGSELVVRDTTNANAKLFRYVTKPYVVNGYTYPGGGIYWYDNDYGVHYIQQGVYGACSCDPIIFDELEIIRNEITENKLSVTNKEVYILPSSGGIGTFLFNILGTAFITLAIANIVIKRRKKIA